jgi:hypothetical protein
MKLMLQEHTLAIIIELFKSHHNIADMVLTSLVALTPKNIQMRVSHQFLMLRPVLMTTLKKLVKI